MANPQEQKWLDHFISTGDGHEATKLAYPNAGKNAKSFDDAIYTRTSQLKTKLVPELLERLQVKLVTGSPEMLKVISDLAKGESVSDSIKLGAAKDWLDRANIKPKEEASQKVQIVINNQPVRVDSSTESRAIIDVDIDPE